ncbi:MAG: hypothetical protein QOE88_2673 [Verrucomicrobiota bacterium]|nr:hypothetical protein [Verrucomicrobiota bacterium]
MARPPQGDQSSSSFVLDGIELGGQAGGTPTGGGQVLGNAKPENEDEGRRRRTIRKKSA